MKIVYIYVVFLCTELPINSKQEINSRLDHKKLMTVGRANAQSQTTCDSWMSSLCRLQSLPLLLLLCSLIPRLQTYTRLSNIDCEIQKQIMTIIPSQR